MTRFLSLLVLGLTLSSSALADEEGAETCVRTKVWDGYADGWGIRTLTSTTLAPNATRNYLVTLYKGNEYQITTCGDEGVQNLDVLLYDLNGNVVLRDDTADREPKLYFQPTETSTYYIVLHARELKTGATGAGVSMAVVYR
ncbi:MAG: hypothetical protein JXX28_06835 [Deltaproteobacteria bacterium]|nr:hypothetical protein [Deltaproteobacteria bacterium]